MPPFLPDIFNRFQTGAPLVRAEPYGSGHIHDTYLGENKAGERFVFQKLNTHVFTQPEAVMTNIEAVCRHLAGKVTRPERQSLRLVPGRDGGTAIVDSDGEIWRAFHFIAGSRPINRPETPAQAFEIGGAFGAFLRQLSDLPESLVDTIPRFHDTPWRFEQLRAALASDTLGRSGEAGREIEFAFARAGQAGRVMARMQAGEIPTRIVHNDAKASNLLLDVETGEGLCVIDLDTVMAGSALYDFGEIVRSGIGEGAEDETGAAISLPRFRAMAAGYLDGAAGLLKAAEREELAFAGRLMALENGVRFLTDYLEGDLYYRTNRDGQNLARARAQFDLVRAMEAAEAEMRDIVGRVGDEAG